MMTLDSGLLFGHPVYLWIAVYTRSSYWGCYYRCEGG